MILTKNQEEDLRNHKCLYCIQTMIPDDPVRRPHFYVCPDWCMKVWYKHPEHTEWVGMRIFFGNSVGIRHYRRSDGYEIHVGNGALYSVTNSDFNIFELQFDDLAKKIDQILFLADF